jgi:capsule polysaccharide export protein KpsE/RkpR
MLIKLILTSLLLFGCCQADTTITLKEFVKLIPQWEVYDDSPYTVVGDNGAAYGHYQIHKVMVDDYNRITGSNAVHTDAFDPKVSAHIAYAVLSHYAQHIQSTGVTPTTDHLLFIWNGGGGAWKRVESPRADQKQINLNTYRSRANPIITRYLNEKKRRQPPQGA